MFRWIAVVGLIGTTAHAQVTVHASDAAPRIGDRSEMTTDVFEVPVADVGIDVTQVGQPEVDFTVDFDVDPLDTTTTTMDVLDPASAPEAETCAEADYSHLERPMSKPDRKSTSTSRKLIQRRVCWVLAVGEKCRRVSPTSCLHHRRGRAPSGSQTSIR